MAEKIVERTWTEGIGNKIFLFIEMADRSVYYKTADVNSADGLERSVWFKAVPGKTVDVPKNVKE